MLVSQATGETIVGRRGNEEWKFRGYASIAVLLKKDYLPLGLKGQTPQVKKGYARNFLFPKKIAIPHTRHTEHLKLQYPEPDPEEEAFKLRTKKLQQKFAKIKVMFKRHVLSNGSLHANVSVENVIEKLKKQQGITLLPEQIVMPEPFSSLGIHSVQVHLDPRFDVTLNLHIQKR